MERITATYVNLYHICKRELWLHANGINMEHQSALVAEARLLHQNSYSQRAKKYKELDLEFMKIDHYDATHKIVHEVKKSKKKQFAHIAQVKFYLFYLEKRVSKMLKLCRQYLHWIQNSVFEGEISPVKLMELRSKTRKIMDETYDSLIIFSSQNPNLLDKEIIGKERNSTGIFL